MKFNYIYLILLLLTGITGFSQSAKVKGVILNAYDQAVSDVTVSAGNVSTTSNSNGFYILDVKADQVIVISYMHVGYQTIKVQERLEVNEDKEINIRLTDTSEQMAELIIDNSDNERASGQVMISPTVIRRIPGANAGVENILKTLPGVYSNNELSTQYAVRGGNYDENLVYVNEIEVYRPFLIRSGQQEGLSFTNTSMLQSVNFSAGGFQAKYGDKLSSVLDMQYRNPTKFKAQLEASMLGGGATVDLVSPNQKWSAIAGIRYRNNALLVKTQDVDIDYRPQYLDFQSIINFNASSKWQWSFLGSVSGNIYDYKPVFGRTDFGTAANPLSMVIQYDGRELDKYQTYFGALKSTFKASENNTYKFIASAYHAKEQEYYDILGQYSIGEVDNNLGSDTYGQVLYPRGVASQLNHGRNDYDALIVSGEIKAQHKIKDNEIEWGVRYVSEDIRDRLVEWEVVDSAGFAITPPIGGSKNNQPYDPYYGPLAPYQNVRATNNATINRANAYLQWSRRTNIGENEIWLNAGLRAHQWIVTANDEKGKAQMVVSPRFQVAIKPNWEKDMIFRLSGGWYHQPPTYREIRAMDGTLNKDVKAQESIHLVLSNDYSFKIKSTPFKLTTDVYYKDLSNVNVYTLENVRIRYMADNNAEAYVYGADIRLNGEIVPGTESWLSFGYLKTEENYNNRGYIARPTDQRLKFGLMFQDYMPAIPNLKMYLNLVYNTGLPGGSPSYADPYDYQLRLNDYKRADAGFSYVFKDESIQTERNWLKNFEEVSLGFEIFNLFNNANAITNTWVRDVYSKSMYGIPNRMTMRTFNVKLNFRM